MKAIFQVYKFFNFFLLRTHKVVLILVQSYETYIEYRRLFIVTKWEPKFFSLNRVGPFILFVHSFSNVLSSKTDTVTKKVSEQEFFKRFFIKFVLFVYFIICTKEAPAVTSMRVQTGELYHEYNIQIKNHYF